MAKAEEVKGLDRWELPGCTDDEISNISLRSNGCLLDNEDGDGGGRGLARKTIRAKLFIFNSTRNTRARIPASTSNDALSLS